MLNEFAAAKPEDRGPILQIIGTAARTAPWSEVEPALFQAAAKANDTATKRTLLQLLQGVLYSRNFRKAGKPELPPVPSDAPTREALNALLQDESVQEADDYREDGAQTVADTTASIFLWSRFRPEEQGEWMNLWRTSPRVASAALRAHARALVTGQPVPPRPNAANVPAEEVQKFVKELSALSPSEIHAAVRSKPLSEQLALILHLRQLPEWPASLRKAHFAITTVRTDGEKATAVLQGSKWQERHFDDAARQELEAAVEKAAQDGNTVAVAIQADDLLSGLTLSVRPTERKFPGERLANMKLQGLEDKPVPVAVMFYGFRGGTGQEQIIPAHSSLPIWKDPAITQAWKDQYLKSEAKAGTPGGPQPADTEDSYNSHSFEHRIQATFALKPSARGAFFIQWQALAIQPTASASPDAEEP